LQRGDSRTAEWLGSSGLAQKPRLAAQLSVHGGWERAVETAHGGTDGRALFESAVRALANA